MTKNASSFFPDLAKAVALPFSALTFDGSIASTLS